MKESEVVLFEDFSITADKVVVETRYVALGYYSYVSWIPKVYLGKQIGMGWSAPTVVAHFGSHINGTEWTEEALIASGKITARTLEALRDGPSFIIDRENDKARKKAREALAP